MTTTTAAQTAPAPTTAPAPVVPPPPAPAPAPVAALRRSVLLLAAAVGGLAVAGLLYALVDRPGLREPLEAAAQIIGAAATAAGVVWGVSRASR
ncbi:hypothetical protein OHA57_00070 [Streptomyces anulatus]|uniref:hypothetical protein n=1 Tax=Streptomyces anulatus TaxID=1892 RepID=UPI002DDAB27B|nr:hypothetical protein [Streptomyces anulatus]WSC59224.1 hypothetical protein OHA57_00070 [Streptomyces anulatus]WSV80304.1 hypothetical protein OG333_38545 [Streptomyces anulatus]